jgi:hypothetical protein
MTKENGGGIIRAGMVKKPSGMLLAGDVAKQKRELQKTLTLKRII